ncbi:CWC2 [[Candida] subhashii]|uniref:Pre-mRNA-splicing factor CWC2 n=1 Tax=[Candida] subhashii TaxID=561895 RepID=A0A8J5QQ52_9ASCO|nr:CWC2 [[Candida] subhashii]KAG7665424.1 CWC2 [[Candida] subhashii]
MSAGPIIKQADPMSKPARLQVDPDTIPDDDKPPQSGNTFNIWYLKWSGGDSSSRSYTKSKFKVNIAKDTGYTRATRPAPICLFFSRGCCYRGKKCPYFHRLPLETDSFPRTQDCFGRDKTADYRDDMDGVGSFNKVNRTLYVGGLHMKPGIEEIISKYFSEFGEIEKVKVLGNKSCAFVTMRLESQAQFVKEAMQNQSLGGNEVLYIRWASEDPNPQAQRAEKRRLEEIALSTVKNLLKESDVESSVSKKRKVTIIEPEEESEPEKLEHQVKQIQTYADAPIEKNRNYIFSDSTLKELAKLKGKLIIQSSATKENSTSTLASVFGGYTSSDEDN